MSIRIVLFAVKVRESVFDGYNRSFFFFSSSMQTEKLIQEPHVVEELGELSEFGTQVHLSCQSRYTNILYTLDGSIPTRYFNTVRVCDLQRTFFRSKICH